MLKTVEKLKEVRRVDALIDAKLRECDRLRALAKGLTGVSYGDKVQTSKEVADPMAEAVTKVCDLETEINAAIDSFVDLKAEVMNAIDALEDPKQVEVLYRRYLDFQTWDDLAEDMGITRQWALKLHERAIGCLKFTAHG